MVTFTSDANDANGDDEGSSTMSLFIIREVKPEHPLNGYVPNISILPGLLASPIVIVVMPLQFVNVLVPIDLIVLGIKRDVSPLQFSKALSSMLVSEAGN